jgi:hypothetical protein
MLIALPKKGTVVLFLAIGPIEIIVGTKKQMPVFSLEGLQS